MDAKVVGWTAYSEAYPFRYAEVILASALSGVRHDMLSSDAMGNVPDMVLALYNGFEINGVEFHTATSGTLPLADTPWMAAMVELGDMVVGKHTGRQSPDDITLFCTAGLSGTEVAVASEALRRADYPYSVT